MKNKDKTVYRIAAFILGAAAIVHFIRVIMGLSLKLGNWEAPMWLSVIAVVIAGYLSFYLLRRD